MIGHCPIDDHDRDERSAALSIPDALSALGSGAGYWAHDSTQREWTRLENAVYPSPRKSCMDFYTLLAFPSAYRGQDRSYVDLMHKECDGLSNQRTTGEGTPLSAALFPRLPLLLSVTVLPPLALFAVGYALLRHQRRHPSPPPEPTRAWW